MLANRLKWALIVAALVLVAHVPARGDASYEPCTSITANGQPCFYPQVQTTPIAPTYSTAQTPVTAASGNVANASAAATLAGVAAKTNYLTGFQITAAGATAAACVNATVAGVITGTMTYTFCVPAGTAAGATPLSVSFNPPIPASAVNTAIVVTLPALGAGNTNAAVSAQGFYQ